MKKALIMIVVFLALLMPISSLAKSKKKEYVIIPMGLFKITAYCPCQSCSDNFGRRCAKAGTYARSNHTIAVDPDVIDLGSTVKIGNKLYKAEDVGGAVQGDHIDIFFDTHEEVEEFGLQYKDVKVIKKK